MNLEQEYGNDQFLGCTICYLYTPRRRTAGKIWTATQYYNHLKTHKQEHILRYVIDSQTSYEHD